MRVPTGLLLAALLVLLPVTSLALTAEAPPNFQAGDTWVRTAQVASQGSSLHASDTTTVEGQANLTVNGTSYDVYILDNRRVTKGASGAQTFTQWANTTQWITRDEHGLVKTVTNVTQKAGPREQSFQRLRVYHEPCETFHYPMAVGDNWTVTCSSTTYSQGSEQNSTRTRDYHVVGTATITVPAGTFETFIVANTTEDHGDRIVEHYAPSACGPVKTTTRSGADTFTLNLTRVRCQATGVDLPVVETADGSQGSPGPGVLGLVGGLVLAAMVAGTRRP